MRAAIFIDGAYLLNRVYEAECAADYSQLADYFLAPLRKNIPLDLLRCYFYDCPPWMSATPSEDERRRMAAHDRFVVELEDLDRWSVRLGKLERRRGDGRDVFAQKRVDVLLAVDMVRHAAAGHIQHAVIVAGDSDFIPAVIAAKECGATVTIWCARDRTPHRELLVAADEVCYFDWRTFPSRAPSSTRTAGSTGISAPPAPPSDVGPIRGVAGEAYAPAQISTQALPTSVPAVQTADYDRAAPAPELKEAETEPRRRRGQRGGQRHRKTTSRGPAKK